MAGWAGLIPCRKSEPRQWCSGHSCPGFRDWLLRSHSLFLGQRNPQTSCGPQFGSSSFEEGQTDHLGWCTGRLNVGGDSRNRIHFAIARPWERERKGRDIRKEHLGIQNENGGWQGQSWRVVFTGSIAGPVLSTWKREDMCWRVDPNPRRLQPESGWAQQGPGCSENTEIKCHGPPSSWSMLCTDQAYRTIWLLSSVPKKVFVALFTDLSVITLLYDYRRE